jgi:hypothetical protein
MSLLATPLHRLVNEGLGPLRTDGGRSTSPERRREHAPECGGDSKNARSRFTDEKRDSR